MGNDTMPFISVVIPSYNHAHLIDRTIRSVIKQSYKNWEIIIVDNYSHDNTEEVVSSFTDPRIRLYKIRNNGIIAASRNKGVNESSGEWVAFLDSDDWWTEDKLQICTEYMSNTTDVIYHDLTIHKDSLFSKIIRKKIKSRKLKEPVLQDLVINGNAIANSSVVVRKNALTEIGGVDESQNIVACEDYSTWLKLALHHKCFVYIPKALGYYYLSDQGNSNKDMSVPMKYVLSKYIHILNHDQMQRMESILHYTKGRFLIGQKEIKASRENILFALKYGNYVIRLKSLLLMLYISYKTITKKI